jgi:Domain of unknown function (DUF4249)
MDFRFVKVVLLAMLLPLGTACTLKEEAELVFPNRPGKLFVEGYLAAGQPIKLTFIRSSTFQQDLSVQLIWNAQAELLLPDTVLALQNLFYKEKESGKAFNYVHPYQLPAGLTGDSLRLRLITADKMDTLYAATALVEPVRISGWQVREKQITVSCGHAAMPQNRYYGIYLEYQVAGNTSRSTQYYDFAHITDPQIDFVLDVPAGKRPYRIILYRITPANYHFQRALSQAHRSNIDPFEAPVVLPSNIRGGQGIFTYSTADTLEL